MKLIYAKEFKKNEANNPPEGKEVKDERMSEVKEVAQKERNRDGVEGEETNETGLVENILVIYEGQVKEIFQNKKSVHQLENL